MFCLIIVKLDEKRFPIKEKKLYFLDKLSNTKEYRLEISIYTILFLLIPVFIKFLKKIKKIFKRNFKLQNLHISLKRFFGRRNNLI